MTTPHPTHAGQETPGKPFTAARSLDKRLKLFLWGDSGVGKTTLALQFPKPAIIDLEGGADLYGDSFSFDVLRASTPDEVMAAVEWLRTHPHPYQTLVIDPITVYWDALQKKWSDIFLRRRVGSKGFKYEFYDLQPKDWLTIKAEFKALHRQLHALDMNVVVTARQKTQYADGGFMRAVGHTFDGEKSLPYLFDTIVRLYRDEKGRFLAECVKDRSRKLPQKEFESSYATFEAAYGKETLGREARPTPMISSEQKQSIEEFMTRFRMTPEQVRHRLASYGAETLDDLTEANATLILDKLQAALGDEGTHARKEHTHAEA